MRRPLKTALRWLSRIALIVYIVCMAIGIAAVVVGYRQDPLAFAALIMIGLPWTMAGRWITTGSVGIGVALISAGVFINVAILITAVRLSRYRSPTRDPFKS